MNQAHPPCTAISSDLAAANPPNEKSSSPIKKSPNSLHSNSKSNAKMNSRSSDVANQQRNGGYSIYFFCVVSCAVVSILFCFPLGTFSLMFAIFAQSAANKKRYRKSKILFRSAKLFALSAFAVGLMFIVLTVYFSLRRY